MRGRAGAGNSGRVGEGGRGSGRGGGIRACPWHLGFAGARLQFEEGDGLVNEWRGTDLPSPDPLPEGEGKNGIRSGSEEERPAHHSISHVKRRSSVLPPLPLGEGWGEGQLE